MPWVIGIDEAGYGPNLGPLLQAAVAVKLPIEDLAGWDTLSPCVRKSGGRWGRDRRLVIDDSKKLYHGANALERLERGVFGAFGFAAQPFGQLLQRMLLPWCLVELQGEAWFDAGMPVPLDIPHVVLERDRLYFQHQRPPDVEFLLANVTLSPTPWFNQVVEATGSKTSLLSNGVVESLRTIPDLIPGNDHLIFLCDKQGSRNYYLPLLQSAFTECQIYPELERSHESRYAVEGLGRVITVLFRPKADGESLSVALASMVCKYIREVCMKQFNAYWATHVPGLRATAGYPMDARRFYQDITPTMAALGLSEHQVWRIK